MNSPIQMPGLQFAKTTLSNGLDVIIHRRGHLPLVAVNLWYHVGSKNEERRQRGFAHLFEHLMFEGSEHFPSDFFKPLQRLGASVNGSTSADRTNYFEDVPAAHLELALAMESDRMGHLLAVLNDSKLRIQKDVVKNEYRQNYANRPYGQVWRTLAEALYPPAHPYSWLTIGVMEDVEAATREDVESFFRRYYVPSNASLCLVGEIEPERGFALAERYFGTLTGGTKSLLPWAHLPRLADDVTIRLYDRVELDRDYLIWHTVPQFHADDPPLSLLADILARGKSSRLYRRLVVEEALAQDVSAYQAGRELAGTFGIVVTLRPGQAWARARAVVEEEITNIADLEVRADELERVQNGRLAGFVYALDQIGGFGGVADRLNAYNIYVGDPGRITSDLELYQKVTPDEISNVASQYLVAQHRVELTVLGGPPLVVVPPLDRSVAPQPASVVVFRVPKPEIRTLRCGAPLCVTQSRDLPIVALSVFVGAGAGAHGPQQGGLASLTAGMMDEGTASRSSQALAEAAERMGTSLHTSSGWDGSNLSFQCLTPHLEDSLDLAVDVLLNPVFPESEWTRVRGQTLAALRAERDRAEAIGYRGLLRELYGASHPYRTSVDGDEESVARLELESLRRFYQAHYRPSRASWIAAGDIDPDGMAEMLDAKLGSWTGSAEPLPPIEGGSITLKSKLVLLDRPRSAQAVILVGHIGVPRLHPDHTDLLVLNQILGGLFTSRLNRKLREEKGFTYGIRSHFDFRRGAGPFSVSAAVQTDRVAEALDDVRQELVDIVSSRPPTVVELDDARRALIEGHARQFETPSALVSRFGSLFLHDLPFEHHSGYAERLEGVTVSSLMATAGRQIRPEELVAVVVADADAVAGPLEKLTWGELELIASGINASDAAVNARGE
jgi:zinc protease